MVTKASGRDHDDGLQHRGVLVADRLLGQPAEAVQAEHRLGDHRAGQQLAEQDAGDGQRRQQRVARARGATAPRRARRPWRGRRRRRAASAPRRCCASGSAPAAPRSGWRASATGRISPSHGPGVDHRDPAELEGEDLDQHDAEPEDRDRDEQRRQRLDGRAQPARSGARFASKASAMASEHREPRSRATASRRVAGRLAAQLLAAPARRPGPNSRSCRSGSCRACAGTAARAARRRHRRRGSRRSGPALSPSRGSWNLIRIASPGSACSSRKAAVKVDPDQHQQRPGRCASACRDSGMHAGLRPGRCVRRGEPGVVEARPADRLEAEAVHIGRGGEGLRLLEDRDRVGLVDARSPGPRRRARGASRGRARRRWPRAARSACRRRSSAPWWLMPPFCSSTSRFFG